MKLSEWQKSEKISNTELARKIGVHPSFISHIHAGRKRPSPKIALKIESEAGGKVSLRELLYPEKILPDHSSLL